MDHFSSDIFSEVQCGFSFGKKMSKEIYEILIPELVPEDLSSV